MQEIENKLLVLVVVSLLKFIEWTQALRTLNNTLMPPT